MTKMQVFAKSVVLALGLFALNTVLGLSLVISTCSADRCLYGNPIVILVSFGLLLCLVVYFGFIRDSGFALFLAGRPALDDKSAEFSDFIKALRITIIFSGLIFLPWVLRRNITVLPELFSMMRALLFTTFGSEIYSHHLPKNFMDLLMLLKGLAHTCLIAYLIIGAPAFVKWQVRKNFTKISANPKTFTGEQI